MSTCKRASRKLARPITLMEVMLAFVILGIILYFLFSPFRETAIMNQKTENALQTAFSNHNIERRIIQLVSLLEDSFESDGKTLTFATSIGVDPETELSSSVNILLRTTEKEELVLDIWPKEEKKEKTKHLRSEVLLNGVNKIDFSFYSLDGGRYSEHSVWKEKNPPDSMRININKELSFGINIAKETEGIAF